MKQVLFDYGCTSDRVHVHGYEEVGSTTTAFDMMVRNRVDRFHLAMEAFALARKAGVIDADTATRLIESIQERLASHRDYIIENGDDPLEITNWIWHSR
jgi:xylulose-5-phosphate/fructose-6-phosphate phosphoketolase